MAVISEALTISPKQAESLNTLLRQLSSSATPPTQEEWEQIAGSNDSVLLLARDSERIVGMLTLVAFRVPTGVRMIIEDVVVDESHRGQRIGQTLIYEALSRAQAAGARTVDLTSRPSREAANRLYQKLGFQQRESNVYRYSLVHKRRI